MSYEHKKFKINTCKYYPQYFCFLSRSIKKPDHYYYLVTNKINQNRFFILSKAKTAKELMIDDAIEYSFDFKILEDLERPEFENWNFTDSFNFSCRIISMINYYRDLDTLCIHPQFGNSDYYHTVPKSLDRDKNFNDTIRRKILELRQDIETEIDRLPEFDYIPDTVFMS